MRVVAGEPDSGFPIRWPCRRSPSRRAAFLGGRNWRCSTELYASQHWWGTKQYRFTVDDPATFTKPFTVVSPMQRLTDKIYEYACHEGNVGMHGILSGARAQERENDRKK